LDSKPIHLGLGPNFGIHAFPSHFSVFGIQTYLFCRVTHSACVASLGALNIFLLRVV